MKKLVLTFITFLSILNFIQCQTRNIIKLTEFNNIEINGVRFIDFKNSNGDQNTIKALFGVAKNIEKDDDPIYGGETLGITYYYDGFEFGFYEEELGAFKITNNNFNITIQGITITIGDNIDLLGDVVFNTMRDGNHSIVYQYCDGCNSFISIRFNQLTKLITEIIFIEQT